MIRKCLLAASLVALLVAPATAQDACIQAVAADGAPIYFAPSSGHEVSVDPDSKWVRITLGDMDQTCSMTFSDHSKVGLGETWFGANAVHCKTFDAQLLYVSPRDGGELLMVLDGMTLYPKCEQ